MGKEHKQDDILGDGFSVYGDHGEKEHFTKNFFSDGYTSDKGTHIDPHILDDGFSVTRRDGDREDFHQNFFDDGYSGTKGTKAYRDTFGTGTTIYTDDRYGGHSGSGGYEIGYGSLGRYGVPGGGYGTGYIPGPPVPRVMPPPSLRERFKKDRPSFTVITLSWLLFLAYMISMWIPFLAISGEGIGINLGYLTQFDGRSNLALAIVAVAALGFCTYLTNSRRRGIASICAGAFSLGYTAISFVADVLRCGSNFLYPVQNVANVFLSLGIALAVSADVGETIKRIKKSKVKMAQAKPKALDVVFLLLVIAVCVICGFLLNEKYTLYALIEPHRWILLVPPSAMLFVRKFTSKGNIGQLWFGISLLIVLQCAILWFYQAKGTLNECIFIALFVCGICLAIYLKPAFDFSNAEIFSFPVFAQLILYASVMWGAKFAGRYVSQVELEALVDFYKTSTYAVFMFAGVYISLRLIVEKAWKIKKQ